MLTPEASRLGSFYCIHFSIYIYLSLSDSGVPHHLRKLKNVSLETSFSVRLIRRDIPLRVATPATSL